METDTKGWSEWPGGEMIIASRHTADRAVPYKAVTEKHGDGVRRAVQNQHIRRAVEVDRTSSYRS